MNTFFFGSNSMTHKKKNKKLLEQLNIPLCLETFSVVNKEKAKIINFLLCTYIVSNVCAIIAGNYPAYLANVNKTKSDGIKIYIANINCIRDYKHNLVLKYLLLDKNFQFNKRVFRHKKNILHCAKTH